MRFVLLCLFLLFGSLEAMAKKPAAVQIGVQTLSYEDTSRKRPVPVELWYPTSATGAANTLVHSKPLRDAPLKGGAYPLIVLSHGHGGDPLSLSWLADYFVQKGYIVASVEHHGNSRKNFCWKTSLRFWERPRDVSFAIRQLLTDFEGHIDPERIGFVGYSLGGMTGLALGGAMAKNVKEAIIAYQKLNQRLALDWLDTIDFSEAEGDFFEPRIKAIALLAPATFIFPPQSLKQVKVPVALVVSKGDEVLPFHEHAHRIITHLPAKLKMLKDKLSHHVFTNPIEPDEDRSTIHQEVGSFLADFFKEQLY